MSLNNLLIIGTGQHGTVVKEIAESMHCFDKIDFLDDKADLAVGIISDSSRFIDSYSFAFVSIGDNTIRQQLIGKLQKEGYAFPIIRHPSAVVSPSAKIGANVLLCANTVVDTETVVADGTFLSVGAIVGHHCQIGEFCHIAVGAIVPNNSIVPEQTKVEAGRIFKNR